MACPYFMPTDKFEGGGWPHPSRLPLGAGWTGRCCASIHEEPTPNEEDLREFCNMGYAAKCSRLPQKREWDAVRFSVSRDRGVLLSLWFVCELDHAPAAHGKLEYDVTAGNWTSCHSDSRIQRMADCYVESYLIRRGQNGRSS